MSSTILSREMGLQCRLKIGSLWLECMLMEGLILYKKKERNMLPCMEMNPLVVILLDELSKPWMSTTRCDEVI